MEKPVYLFLIFFLLLSGATMADPIGLRLGLFVDSPNVLSGLTEVSPAVLAGVSPAVLAVLVGGPQLFLSPHVEYKQRFGNVDVYAGGEYTFGLTSLHPQFLFAEERIGLHLPLDISSELLIKFQNKNDFRFNPEEGGEAVGRAQPSVGYGLFLPWGELSLALGTPLDYPLWGGGEDIIFGLEPRLGYISPFWVGIEAAGKFVLLPNPSVDGMEIAVNYAQDQLYGALIFDVAESGDYLSLKVEADYFFNFIILKGGIKLENLAAPDALALAVSVGIKYRF